MKQMKIVDGKAIATRLREDLKEKIQKASVIPGLAVVIVGNDPASQIYVRNKIKACGELGIRSYSYELPETATQEEVEALLDTLAQNEEIDGILLQLPLPFLLRDMKILQAFPRSYGNKDVCRGPHL